MLCLALKYNQWWLCMGWQNVSSRPSKGHNVHAFWPSMWGCLSFAKCHQNSLWHTMGPWRQSSTQSTIIRHTLWLLQRWLSIQTKSWTACILFVETWPVAAWLWSWKGSENIMKSDLRKHKVWLRYSWWPGLALSPGSNCSAEAVWKADRNC